MGHRVRMRDKRFSTAERFGQREVAQSVQEGAHGCLSTGEFDREHRSETALLGGGNIVTRVARQPWEVNRAQCWVISDRGDEFLSVLLMSGEANLERTQPAKGQIRIRWAWVIPNTLPQ